MWKLGDGETVKADLIKRRSYREQAPKPNEFFQDMYRRDFAQSEAADERRTTPGQREEREDRSARWYLDEQRVPRSGESISALFCSPTMELGIDIGGLSVVHLRNAPAEPGQLRPAFRPCRPERAGRTGLHLLFELLATRPPLFPEQAALVAGVVQAPRLDLCNRELLLTHLNALAISEIGLPGLETQGGERPSIMRLVADDNAEMPACTEVSAQGLRISSRQPTPRFKATFTPCDQRLRD